MIKVYGASDDLIEIEGDINEEFDVYNQDSLLTFDDGTVLSVKYNNDGVWKIERTKEGTATYCKLYEVDAGSENRGEGYTDIVTLVGRITSVGIKKGGVA